MEGRDDRPWADYEKESFDEGSWFPDGVWVSNPMKWQQRLQRDGGMMVAKREEEWYDWMETSEAHRVDEQIEIQLLTESGVGNEFFKWCEESGLRVSQNDYLDRDKPILFSRQISVLPTPEKSFTWDDYANDEIGTDADDCSPLKPKRILQDSVVRRNLGPK
jgi:hypothetical protein